MKKILPAVILFTLAVNAFAAAKNAPLTPEMQADRMYEQRNAVTDTAKAVENADALIALRKKIFDGSPSDTAFYKYVLAVDFKYANLVSDREVKKQAFKDLIAVMDKFCEGNTLCASSDYMAYCAYTLWGRYGDIIDVMEAAMNGVGDKIKNSAERLYASDKSFKNYVTSFVLGRLHWKAPNIVFIMTWPDKDMSKKYLEEYIAHDPLDIQAKTYLADTLWDLGDREKATALYKEAIKMKPRASEYFEDTGDLEVAKARAKEQGIQ